jgi:hypothetical protein
MHTCHASSSGTQCLIHLLLCSYWAGPPHNCEPPVTRSRPPSLVDNQSALRVDRSAFLSAGGDGPPRSSLVFALISPQPVCPLRGQQPREPGCVAMLSPLDRGAGKSCTPATRVGGWLWCVRRIDRHVQPARGTLAWHGVPGTAGAIQTPETRGADRSGFEPPAISLGPACPGSVGPLLSLRTYATTDIAPILLWVIPLSI